GAVRAHRVADDVHLLDLQAIEQALQAARIEVGARAIAYDGIALAPARAVHQDDTVASVDQGLDVAMEVGPAAGTRPRAVQHHDHLVAVADVVVMDPEIVSVLLDG